MKRTALSIDKIRESLNEYKDVPITIRVNKGRNKISYYDCKIINIFPSVFQVELEDKETRVYSYSGVLCGEIKLKKRTLQ